MQRKSEIDIELEKVLAAGERAAVVSAASIRACAPSEIHVRMLVREDGSTTGSVGGGELESRIIAEAQDVIRSGTSRRIRVGVSDDEEKWRGMEPGGKLKFFIELVHLIPHLYLLGAGELPLQIARFAGLLHYRVTVMDSSAEFACKERFPDAQVIVDDDFEKVFLRAEVNPSGYIIIATRNHEHEEKVLELSLRSGVSYIGMAACSEQKKKRYLQRMTEKGFSRNELRALHAPIGLEIHAQTMEEIALSIMAEITGKIRSQGVPGR